MRTKVIIFVGVAACFAFVAHSASAQNSVESVRPALDETLFRSVCERVQTPLVFSTRDSVFALSLPVDEPAEVYVQLTVGRNGKVKGKLTRVSANHIGGYVAPAFMAATKELRVDRSLLAEMAGKDTALLLTFPLEYCHVLDTTVQASRSNAYPYRSRLTYDNIIKPWSNHNKQFRKVLPNAYIGTGSGIENPYVAQSRLPRFDDYSGRLNFYIVFLNDTETAQKPSCISLTR